MNKNVSPKDLRTISAYLDGQLSSIERNKIEARFTKEESLHQAFKELQQTRLLLKHASIKKVPHNFTLSSEMATQIKPVRKSRILPALSISSVMATFLLAFVLLFELLPGILNQTASQKSAPDREMVMEAAPAVESFDMQSESQAPMIIEWGNPAYKNNGGYGGGGGTSDTAVQSMAAPQPEVAIDTAEIPNVGGILPPEIASGAGGDPPKMEPQGTELPQTTLSERQAVEPVTGTGPILGIRSEEETDIYNNSVLNILADQIQSYQNPTKEPTSLFKWLQISLATIAFITGISAILLWKRSKF
jgi:hypothetical protein